MTSFIRLMNDIQKEIEKKGAEFHDQIKADFSGRRAFANLNRILSNIEEAVDAFSDARYSQYHSKLRVVASECRDTLQETLRGKFAELTKLKKKKAWDKANELNKCLKMAQQELEKYFEEDMIRELSNVSNSIGLAVRRSTSRVHIQKFPPFSKSSLDNGAYPSPTPANFMEVSRSREVSMQNFEEGKIGR